jgi:hypothetical protein
MHGSRQSELPNVGLRQERLEALPLYGQANRAGEKMIEQIQVGNGSPIDLAISGRCRKKPFPSVGWKGMLGCPVLQPAAQIEIQFVVHSRLVDHVTSGHIEQLACCDHVQSKVLL